MPSLIESLQNECIVDIAAGNEHCLALTDDGKRVYAWGQGKYGALGTSKSQNFIDPVLIDLDQSITVTQIAAGSRHSAIISNRQFLYTFGLATSGQLGLG